MLCSDSSVLCGVNPIFFLKKDGNRFYQTLVEGAVSAEGNFSTICNFYKGKRDASKRGKYRKLKLTGHILKVVHSIMKKFTRQHADKNEMQFGLMIVCGNHSILKLLQNKY